MHNEYLREGFSMWHLPNLFNHKYFTLVYTERLVIGERDALQGTPGGKGAGVNSINYNLF